MDIASSVPRDPGWVPNMTWYFLWANHILLASLLLFLYIVIKVKKFIEIITIYKGGCGHVNAEKSKMVFNKSATEETRVEIMNTMQIKHVDHHAKCLSPPTILSISKKVTFTSLKEQICKKILGHKEKLLSNPKKEILLKHNLSYPYLHDEHLWVT